ncbi:MAG: acyltransferase, partial [Bacteroidetes bacterium]
MNTQPFKTPYLSNLTPLRGIAAMLTVIFHVDLFLGFGAGALLKDADTHLLGRLYLMVDVFFVLSGFIMMHVYGKWFSERVTFDSFKQFTIARFARVYPLHFVVLLFTIGTMGIFAALGVPKNEGAEIENNLFSVLTNLLLLHSMNLHTWFTWAHASWSISTEWWMYMLFPFLVVPFNKLNLPGRIAVTILCFAGYAAIMLWIVPIVTVPESLSAIRIDPALMTINVAYQYGFLRCLFGFVLGMMMYKGYEDGWGKAMLGKGYVQIALVLGLGICLHFGVPDVFSVIFFPLIILSAAYGSAGMDRVFRAKPLQKLGDWSFSIYMVHQPMMFLIFKLLDYLNPPKQGADFTPAPPPDMITSWIIGLVFIALMLPVAALCYRFVETPARRWLNP